VAVSQPYNFYASECNNDGASCAACNTGPTSNDPGNVCVNPTTPGLDGWCLDQPPAASAGKSKLCRQVAVIDDPLAPLPDPLPDNYPQAAVWNHRCATALTADGPNVWSNYMLISGQWLKGSALPAPPEPPALPSCINVAEVVTPNLGGGPVNQAAIVPHVTIEGGATRPFLGNTSMESYDRSNCLGCHAKAVVTNDKDDKISTDFMYWLSLEVAAVEANFISYYKDYQGSQCSAPENVMVAEFLLSGAVQNSIVNPQTFDMVVSIQIPESVPDPVLTAHDALQPAEPWLMDGTAVNFELDPGCAPGACEVDSIFPPVAGTRWVQFRSTAPISMTQDDSLFSSLLRYTFPAGHCDTLNESQYRVWATDSSEQEHGNFVDGALESGSFAPLPNLPVQNVPILGVAGLGGLAMLLLLTGWGLLTRQRNH